MTKRLPLTVLDQVRVPRPCTQPWDAMTGDDQRRFCDECGLHVHNLSAMEREEAESLVAGATGRLCVRFEQDDRGRVVSRPGLVRPKWWIVRACALLWSAVGLMLGGCEQSGSAGGGDSVFKRLFSGSSRQVAGVMRPLPPAPPPVPPGTPATPNAPVAPPPPAD